MACIAHEHRGVVESFCEERRTAAGGRKPHAFAPFRRTFRRGRSLTGHSRVRDGAGAPRWCARIAIDGRPGVEVRAIRENGREKRNSLPGKNPTINSQTFALQNRYGTERFVGGRVGVGEGSRLLPRGDERRGRDGAREGRGGAGSAGATDDCDEEKEVVQPLVQENDRDDKTSGLPKTTGALNDAARETGGALHYEERCRPLQHPGGEGGFYKSDLTSSFGLLDEEQLWEPLKGDGSAEFDNGGTSSDPRSAVGEGLVILN